jgi:hypothetical protein
MRMKEHTMGWRYLLWIGLVLGVISISENFAVLPVNISGPLALDKG